MLEDLLLDFAFYRIIGYLNAIAGPEFFGYVQPNVKRLFFKQSLVIFTRK